jgi:hypothetical protein
MGRGVARAVGRSVGSAAGSSSSFNIGEIIGICVGIAVGLLALYCICVAICGGGCSDSTSESPPPATGKEQRCDQAGSLVVPGRGYDWAIPNDPSDLSMHLKPNLVAHDDGRVEPAFGFAWANPQDPEDERVVQVPWIASPSVFLPAWLLAHIPLGLFLKCAIRLQTSVNATEGQSSELPPGWEQRTDANGQIYVVDHTSHTSTRTDPHSPPRGEQRTNAPPAILDEYNAADRITLACHIASIASKTYTVRKFLPSFA